MPAGMPASTEDLPRSSAETGVALAGLRTMVLPAAIDGATLWATRLSGS
jgi:hypothetical protein